MEPVDLNKDYAVLTGDFIASADLSTKQHEKVQRMLREAWADARESFGPGVLAEAGSLFRGDSWQIVLADPSLAPKVAILIRASLRCGVIANPFAKKKRLIPVDSRVAIGVGRIATLNQGESTGLGEAYTRSGRRLERLSKQRLALGVALGEADSAGSEEPEEMRVILTLVDFIVSNWTTRQSQAIRGTILHPALTQRALGETLDPPAKQHALTQLLDRAGWHSVDRALKLLSSRIVNR